MSAIPRKCPYLASQARLLSSVIAIVKMRLCGRPKSKPNMPAELLPVWTIQGTGAIVGIFAWKRSQPFNLSLHVTASLLRCLAGQIHQAPLQVYLGWALTASTGFLTNFIHCP